MTKKTPKKTKKVSKKVNGILISWVIALAIFIVGVIICSIDGGIYDYQITKAIADAPELEPLGAFMKPSPFWGLFENFDEIDQWVQETWASGNIGQLFTEVLIVFAAIWMFILLGQISGAKKKAVKEYKEINKIEPKTKLEVEQKTKLKVNLPKSAKYFKYCVYIVVVGIIILIINQGTFKRIWDRQRPSDPIGSFSEFTPWWVINNLFGDGESFVSGHTGQATILITVALILLGSRKKILGYIMAGLSATYVVLMGMGRMASNDHWFSDTLFAGFIGYTVVVFVYLSIMNIPAQERIYRYKYANAHYNEGYLLVSKAKSMLGDDPEKAMQEISKGMEKLATAKENVDDLVQAGYDYVEMQERLGDLLRRFGMLIQEYKLLEKSEENMKKYILEWSYVF
jgi:membrane-associated phospholipid phosphatase